MDEWTQMLLVEFEVHILFFVSLSISPSPVLDILLSWDWITKEKKKKNKVENREYASLESKESIL